MLLDDAELVVPVTLAMERDDRHLAGMFAGLATHALDQLRYGLTAAVTTAREGHYIALNEVAHHEIDALLPVALTRRFAGRQKLSKARPMT